MLNKLYTNQKLTRADIRDLENILWNLLGSEQEYRKIAGQTPVTEFILSIIGLDKNVVLERFAKFINSNNYNSNQIEFIHLIIENICENGFIKDKRILSQAPYSNHGGISELFPASEAGEIVQIINSFAVAV